jgi:hypothetical protein
LVNANEIQNLVSNSRVANRDTPYGFNIADQRRIRFVKLGRRVLSARLSHPAQAGYTVGAKGNETAQATSVSVAKSVRNQTRRKKGMSKAQQVSRLDRSRQRRSSGEHQNVRFSEQKQAVVSKEEQRLVEWRLAFLRMSDEEFAQRVDSVLGNAYDELDSLVGPDDVVEQVSTIAGEIIDYVRWHERSAGGPAAALCALHEAFLHATASTLAAMGPAPENTEVTIQPEPKLVQ